MKAFIPKYLLVISFLFIFFYFEFFPLAQIINDWQIDLSSLLISFTLEENIIQGNRINVGHNFTLIIDKACNGLTPYFFLLSSIIAFPSTLQHKIKWIVIGYFTLSLLNVFRIWFITQFVLQSSQNFVLAHDYLGNLFLVLTTLLLFFAFIRTRTSIHLLK